MQSQVALTYQYSCAVQQLAMLAVCNRLLLNSPRTLIQWAPLRSSSLAALRTYSAAASTRQGAATHSSGQHTVGKGAGADRSVERQHSSRASQQQVRSKQGPPSTSKRTSPTPSHTRPMPRSAAPQAQQSSPLRSQRAYQGAAGLSTFSPVCRLLWQPPGQPIKKHSSKLLCRAGQSRHCATVLANSLAWLPADSLAPHVAVPPCLTKGMACEEQPGAQNDALLNRLGQPPVSAACSTNSAGNRGARGPIGWECQATASKRRGLKSRPSQ